jgi:acyl carrier protein
LTLVEQLNSVFQSVFDDDEIQVNEEMTADDVEDWDSLTHINLICAVEEKFSVNFTTREIASLSKVGDLMRMLKEKTGQS